MKYMQIVILVFCFGCGNSQQPNISTPLETIEDFESFYKRFYSDSAFQQSRIILPLEGIVKSWDGDSIVEESWSDRDIVVSSKSVFLEHYRNLKVEIERVDSTYFEKYWLENSGFLIERIFVLKHCEWYLASYNISNI